MCFMAWDYDGVNQGRPLVRALRGEKNCALQKSGAPKGDRERVELLDAPIRQKY